MGGGGGGRHLRTPPDPSQGRKALDRPFEHEARYHEVIARQAELVQALDLTKSQKAEGLAADAPVVAPTEGESAITIEAPSPVSNVASKPGRKLRVAV